MILSFRYRIKDARAAKALTAHAYAVNQVWNFLCATQRETERRHAKWLHRFALERLTTGSSQMLGIYSDTISVICRQFDTSRAAARHAPRFRSSFGSRRSLGWVPFKGRCIRLDGDAAIYLKRRYRFWKSRELPAEVREGAFVQDARGRWYVVFQCEVAEVAPRAGASVGIDLGLKTLATLSDGSTVPALQHFRQHEAALATAQRAKNKRRVAAISAKITNARRHHLHEQSTRIVREFAFIAVGNVDAARLKRTKMAKSVSDAGWGTFRNMLRFKCQKAGARYVEADERFSSRTCSECGSIGGPKGIAGLGVRRWECADCGASLDRDVNAARNILRVGLECQPPAVGIAAQALRGINPRSDQTE